MSGPVLKAISNNSKYVAVVLEISPNGQVTSGCLIGKGTSRPDLNLSVPTQTSDPVPTIAGGQLLLGTCRGLFSLRQKGPFIVGAAERFGFDADAGIDGNDRREIPLAFSATPSWSLEITADGILRAEPGGVR